jgi:hypothetical protein
LTRRRLVFLTGLANDLRDSVRRARSRRPPPAQKASADEVKRRLDETRSRLRSQIPPRQD